MNIFGGNYISKKKKDNLKINFLTKKLIEFKKKRQFLVNTFGGN